MKPNQLAQSIIEDTIGLIDEYEKEVDDLNRRSKMINRTLIISFVVSVLIISVLVLIPFLK